MQRVIHAAYLIGWTAAVSAMAVGAGIVASNCVALGRVVP